jgi:hypothetical protein
VIDVIGTSATSCEEVAVDAINTAASRSGTFGAPRSSSRTFTSGNGGELIYREDPFRYEQES